MMFENCFSLSLFSPNIEYVAYIIADISNYSIYLIKSI